MKNIGKKFLLFIILTFMLVGIFSSFKVKCYAAEGNIVIHEETKTL